MQKKFTIPAAHFVVPTDAPPGCEPSKLRGTLGTAAHVWADDPFPKCPPGHHEVVTGPDANGQYTVEFLPVAPPSAADMVNAMADVANATADLSALVARMATPTVTGTNLSDALVPDAPITGTVATTKPKRHPGQPGKNRRDDIIAAIVTKGYPLQREEVQSTLGLKRDGKLGANLAWMVKNGMLVNIPGSGYWLVGREVPQ